MKNMHCLLYFQFTNIRLFKIRLKLCVNLFEYLMIILELFVWDSYAFAQNKRTRINLSSIKKNLTTRENFYFFLKLLRKLSIHYL